MARTKNCIDCGGYIPCRLTIDGRSHVLASRKRCLMCQPFKERQGVRPVNVKTPSKTMKNYASWPEEWKAEHRSRVLQKGLIRKKKLVEMEKEAC